jgi:hypothetical protein
MLALFIAVLLGVPAPAASLAASGPAGVRQLQSGKAAVAGRHARRAPEFQADSTDHQPPMLGAAPGLETELLSRRPSDADRAAPAMARRESSHAPYQARAPPAA